MKQDKKKPQKPQQAPVELQIGRRVLTDDAFRQALLSEPAATLEREYGVRVPEGVRIQVHEETDNLIHFIVPGRPHRFEELVDRDLDDISISRMKEGRTECCTCGSSSAQSMSSLQAGCGC